MKILQINSFGNMSTGRIAVDLYRTILENDDEGIIAYARNSIAEDVSSIKIGNKISVYKDGILTRLTDRAGFYSKKETLHLINNIKKYCPDIIQLHNIHGYYINVPYLFAFLKEYEKPVVWTLHDCWAFTGHCCYYSMVGCEKWKSQCTECMQTHAYPASLFLDKSYENYTFKKETFTTMKNLYLVAVSQWLKNQVKESFLASIPCSVIYNGIDTNIFRPTSSFFRRNYDIEDLFIILGVASTWDARKGLEDFIELSKMLDETCKIVLVGIDTKRKKLLPDNIIAIERTNNLKELAEIYSAVDVFFNASVEETFGLPTVEAISCGTPAIVYNSTALPEVLDDNTGIIVEKGNLNKVVNAIEDIRSGRFKFNNITADRFEKRKCFMNYLELYKKIVSE